MLAVGILGNPLLGNVQDREVDKQLAANQSALHAKVMGEKKTSVFGEYRPIEDGKLATLSDADKTVVTETKEGAKKNALKTVALFPIGMLVAYLLLIGYFSATGGYKPVQLDGSDGDPGH